MKVLSPKPVIFSTAILLIAGVFATTVQASTPHFLINQSTIDYYKSLLEAQELSKGTEGGVAYYTDRDGVEHFAGYKYGRLDDSYAYRNPRTPKIYRGAKGERRSTALTNYHSSALAASSFGEVKIKKVSEKRKKGEKISLRNIMMGHGQVKKKEQ